MRKLLCGTAIIAASGLGSFPAYAEMQASLASSYKPVLVAEGRSRSLCESKPGRIFVPTSSGSECIAYRVTKGFENRPAAVFYLAGDVSPEKANDPRKTMAYIPKQMQALQSLTNAHRVRYIKLGRIGVEGSSGNHGQHGSDHELAVMYGAIDILKQRLGIKTIGLVGQSGGSAVSAGLLTLGRTDVACAVLGSGPFNIIDRQRDFLIARGMSGSNARATTTQYDPSAHVDGVAEVPGRRVFIIGDPNDQAAPFKYQAPFARALHAANHHAVTVKVSVLIDPLHHNTAFYSLPAVGACLNGASDKDVVTTIGQVQKQVSAASRLARQHASTSE